MVGCKKGPQKNHRPSSFAKSPNAPARPVFLERGPYAHIKSIQKSFGPMIFRCKICLLAGSYWCLVGNFREWSTITIKNHPSNPHSHPFPAFSTSISTSKGSQGPMGSVARDEKTATATTMEIPPRPWKASGEFSWKLPGSPAISAETDYIYIYLYIMLLMHIYYYYYIN